jgi:hypothetical protein
LEISDSCIILDGDRWETSGSAETLPNPPKRAAKTPFCLALALLLYKEQGETRLPSRSGRWRKFRDNVHKLARDEERGRPVKWVQEFFGGVANLRKLLNFDRTGFLYVNTATLPRSCVAIEVVEKHNQPVDLIAALEQKVDGARAVLPAGKRRVEEIEPDKAVRDRLIATARHGLCVAGLSAQQELILGKAIYLCKLEELDEELDQAFDRFFDLAWQFDRLMRQAIEQMLESRHLSNGVANVQELVDDDLRQHMHILVMAMQHEANSVIRLGRSFVRDLS